MGNLKIDELCYPTAQPFMETTTPFEDARYVLFGIPLDLTASYRSGARFAPNAIRQASKYMETYSLKNDFNLEDVSMADIGDLKELGDVEGSLRNVEMLIKTIHSADKIPVMMGGEHTVTLGALRALRPDLVIDFDAHLDLRDELFGLRLSHATFMRRALEEMRSEIIYVGSRAESKEEYDFMANADRLTGVNAFDLLWEGMGRDYDFLSEKVEGASSVYISIDMDVLDPAYAPAVCNPSPEGITINMLTTLLEATTRKNVVGFDLTEVAPHYDSGITAINAAYIILQAIDGLEWARRKPQA